METRTRICLAAAVAACFALTGCPGRGHIPTIPTKSETEIAVEQITAEWLAPCERMALGVPDNSVGNLLHDFNSAAGLLTECVTRQRSLVEYLAPVVVKEKARKLAAPAK